MARRRGPAAGPGRFPTSVGAQCRALGSGPITRGISAEERRARPRARYGPTRYRPEARRASARGAVPGRSLSCASAADSRSARTPRRFGRRFSAAIPIPVSLTEKIDHVVRGPAGAQHGSRPRSVYFTALVRKFRRICATFPSSVLQGRQRRSALRRSERPPRGRSSAGSSPGGSRRARDLECADADHRLSRFDLGQVEQVVDQGREPLGGLADEPDLLLLLGGQFAVAAREQKAGQTRIELSGDRSSWLISERKRDLRSESRLSALALSSSSA